jgi:hypothetical protein
MQLCVTPGGKEIQVGLIFKGTAGSDFAWASRPRGTPVYLPDGVTKTPHECDMWDPSVFVKFNTCAWADPLYSATWVEESFCGFVNGSYGAEGVDRSEENLLLCDNLVGQIEAATHKTGGPFKVKAMAKGNTLVWNLCVPPQGVHVALAFSAGFGRLVNRLSFGVAVWACMSLKRQDRWFPARAVSRTARTRCSLWTLAMATPCDRRLASSSCFG